MPPRRRLSGAPGAATPPHNAAPQSSIATSLLQAVRPWPVSFTVAGIRVTVEALSAADWVGVLINDEGDPELENLIDEQTMVLLLDKMIDGQLDPAVLHQRLREVLTVVSGRPWWVTMRILYSAQASWDTIGGYLVLHGVNPQDLSLQGFMDALLATLVRHIDPKDHASFFTKLKMPPKGVEAEPINETREADVFLAYMKGKG